jgi:RimJ/RimL family protein N-acetyltransferase
MDVVGLEGERVRLVPAESAIHVDNAVRWLNNPAVNARLEVNTGLTRPQIVSFFERMSASQGTEFHWAILAENFGHIGFIGLHQVDWRHRGASGGLYVGDTRAWGHGFATDAVRVRTRFAFENLGLHRIDGHTFNPAMRRVYEKCGYVHEGVARQKRWREGRWVDVDLFSLLESDYFAAKTT